MDCEGCEIRGEAVILKNGNHHNKVGHSAEKSPATAGHQGEGKDRRLHNPIVMSLVERGGDIRSTWLDHRSAMGVIRKTVHKDSRLVTDSAAHYKFPPVSSHEFVDHSKFEWVRGDVHTNTLEGFFSVLKRGLVGIYQHVSSQHLDRYLAEFDFRQNTRVKLGYNDEQRADIALKGFAGKRLTYQTTHSEAEA